MKRVLAFVLMLGLLAAYVPVHAGGLTKPEKYEALLLELKNYLNDMGSMELDDLFLQFSSLGAYEHSIMLAMYVNVLSSIEKGDYSRAFSSIERLYWDAAFVEMLNEDDDFGTVEELENYARGRKEEANGNMTKALEYYRQCASFRDSMTRAFLLDDGMLASQYAEGLRWFQKDTYEGYQKAYEIFSALSKRGGYEDSDQLLGIADMLRATPVPKATKTPAPTPKPTVRVTPQPTTSPSSFKTKSKGAGQCTISAYTGSDWHVVIPSKINGNTVIGIEPRVFKGNLQLTSITLPEGLTIIGSMAFNGCKNLTTVVLPDGLTTIGDSAFLQCRSLTNINFPDSIRSVGEYAFQSCVSLTSVKIPKGLSALPKGLFYGCKALANVEFHAGVTSIGDYAFCGDECLTTITIPANVTSIGNFSFSSCPNITFRVKQNTYAYRWCVQRNCSYTTY